jgi:hypothetical protein
MPKSTVQEEDPYKLPEDTHFPARLNKVEQKSREFVYKKGPQAGEKGERVWWEWEFQITEGEYAPLKGYGETEPKTTVTPDGSRNKAAMWIEALRGDHRPLLGLPRRRPEGQGQALPQHRVLALRVQAVRYAGATARRCWSTSATRTS